MTLKNQNNHEVTKVILPFLKLFQHARIESPVLLCSNSVKVVTDKERYWYQHSWLLDLHHWAHFCYITSLRF